MKRIKKWTWEFGIFITNTPYDCTDAVALIDHHVGVRIKDDVPEQFWEEFAKDEDSIRFFVHEITMFIGV